MNLKDIISAILPKSKNMLKTALGHFGYKRFLEDDFIANLEAMQYQKRLSAEVVDAAKDTVSHGQLKPSVTCIDEIVSGSTLRGRGVMYKVDWEVDGTTISSFVNLYDSSKRAKTAFLGQSYFHNLLDVVSTSCVASQMPETNVLAPRGIEYANLVSNILIDAKTLNDLSKSGNNDEILLRLAADFKKLFDLSQEYESFAIGEMNRKGIKADAASFADADYTRDILEKFVYRVNPSAKKQVKSRSKGLKIMDPELLGLLVLFDEGISKHFYSKPNAISHRDPILTNLMKEREGNQYLIDFECTARDTIESWITPLLFKAGTPELEARIIAEAGISIQDAQLAKARDNLLWVGRLTEFANLPNVENRRELQLAANYRFTLAVNDLKGAKLFRLADSLTTYFSEKLKVLDSATMASVKEASSPANRLVSIVNSDPAYDNLQSLRNAFSFRRILRNVGYITAVAAVLVGGYLVLDTKAKRDGEADKASMQRESRFEFADTFYKSRQRTAFDLARDYCLDNPDKVTRFSVYSDVVRQVALTNDLDFNLVLNILKANRIAAGIDMIKTQYRIETVNVFDVFIADQGIPSNIHDPMENLLGGATRLSDLVRKFDGDTNNAVAAFYNPISDGGRYLGSNIASQEEVLSVAQNVRFMTWNAVHGIYSGNLDVALTSPPDDFKIKLEVDLGSSIGQYLLEISGDRMPGKPNVKVKVLSAKNNDPKNDFFRLEDAKLYGAK